MERNLVFLINEKNEYARHLGSLIASIGENTQTLWNMFVVYIELSEKSREKLSIIADRYGYKIKYIKLPEEELEKFQLGEGTHLDKVVFGRLYIPELLKNEKKALYMDIDMTVLGDLNDLYRMNLENHSIGAIPDSPGDQKLSKERLSLPEEKIYFNAGIMLMNLEKLRENRKFQEVVKYCMKPDRALMLNEQDGLNIIFDNKFKTLDYSWNYTHGWSEEYKLSLKEIKLIHFTGGIKPWDCNNYSPYKRLYWKYLNMTPWKGYSPDNNTVGNIIRREMVKLKLNSRKFRYFFKTKKEKE